MFVSNLFLQYKTNVMNHMPYTDKCQKIKVVSTHLNKDCTFWMVPVGERLWILNEVQGHLPTMGYEWGPGNF